MGLDVINEEKLASVVINPALDRVQHDVIPELFKGVGAAIDGLRDNIANTIKNALSGAEFLLKTANNDLNAAIDRLDGAEIEIGPIEVPAFTVKLVLPKKEVA